MAAESTTLYLCHPEAETDPVVRASVREANSLLDDKAMIIRAGALRLRKLTGRATASISTGFDSEEFHSVDEPLDKSCENEILASVPDNDGRPRRALGLPHHLISLSMHAATVIFFLGLLGGLIGFCCFLIGVVLPFQLLS